MQLKKWQHKLIVISLLVLIFGFTLVNLFSYSSQASSSLEQRQLTQKPELTVASLLSGQFMLELEDYFADHFAFRSLLVQAGAYLKEWKGIPGSEQAVLLQQGSDNTVQKVGEASVSNQNNTQYLIYKDRAYTLYQYSPAAAEAYAEAINNFQQSANPELRVYSLLAPTSAEFIESEEYQELTDSQAAAFNHVNEQLASEVGRVDVIDVLKQHTQDNIYFRTDHHWTALGAYYAYTELMSTMGEEAISLTSYTAGEITNFLGSAYKATLNVQLKKAPDTITYYEPLDDYTYTRHLTTGKTVTGQLVDPAYATPANGLYAVFLGGDFPWGEINTGHTNGKKIVVVKDSYGNALIPFLLPHFETVYYVDPRYFTGSLTEFVEEHGATDILFLSSATATRTTGMAQLINQIAIGTENGNK